MTDMLGSGHSFVSNLKDAFGSDFGLEPAADGAHVLYIDEMPPNTIDPSVLAKMKTVTAGGAVATKRKYKSSVSIPLLYILACTNHPISFPTRDASLQTHLRRFKLVYFPHTLSDDEVDKGFRRDFVADEYKMCALLHIALEGVQRILENQAITPVKQDDDIMREWIGESDSISAWLSEYDMFGEHTSHRYSLVRSRSSRNYTCVVNGLTYAVDGLADDYQRAAVSWGTADFYVVNEDRVVNAHDLRGAGIESFGFSNETTIAYEQYKIWYEANGSNKPIALRTFVAEMKRRGYATKRFRSTLLHDYRQVTLFVPKDKADMTQSEYRDWIQGKLAAGCRAPEKTDTDIAALSVALAGDPRSDLLAGLINGHNDTPEPTPDMLRLGYELAVNMLRLAGRVK
jgi:phage/plasmid-associated DNA primase